MAETSEEIKTIKCTVLHYERVKTGENYNEKGHIRVRVSTGVKTVKKLKEIVRWVFIFITLKAEIFAATNFRGFRGFVAKTAKIKKIKKISTCENSSLQRMAESRKYFGFHDHIVSGCSDNASARRGAFKNNLGCDFTFPWSRVHVYRVWKKTPLKTATKPVWKVWPSLFRQDIGSGNPNLQEWNFQSQEQILSETSRVRQKWAKYTRTGEVKIGAQATR